MSPLLAISVNTVVGARYGSSTPGLPPFLAWSTVAVAVGDVLPRRPAHPWCNPGLVVFPESLHDPSFDDSTPGLFDPWLH